MNRRRTRLTTAVIVTALALLAASAASAASAAAAPAAGNVLDPRGKVHVPIGIRNTLDTLKTFGEPEGNFSPGVGTYGVYFWLYGHQDKMLHAPTQQGATVTYGLHPGGLLIPCASGTPELFASAANWRR